MIEVTNIDDISTISDWAELTVVYYNTILSKAKIISLLEDNGLKENVDYSGDELFDSIIQELESRSKLYGPNPPYTIENGIISPLIEWQNCPEYIMCLIFSYWGAADAKEGTSLFEEISNIALKNYLNGKAVTVGFPNIDSLPVQLDTIARLLNEDRSNKNPPVHAKDRGVDVIGWRSFEDERRGQIIILMQCAAGGNWKKKKQILLSVWSQYIHWFFETTIPSMAITEVLSHQKWGDAVENYGIIFDRARLYKSLYIPSSQIEQDLREKIIKWCKSKLN